MIGKASQKPTVLFFGCGSGAGHYLHYADGSKAFDMERVLPFRTTILDAGFLDPRGPQHEGVATCVRLNGWTILSWWDRSVDTRPGSNFSILVEGEYAADYALAAAREAMPNVFARFKYPIVLPEAPKS